MQEVFEKIIERLEEEARFYNSASDVDQNIRSGVIMAKDIVQEEAAKYSDGWIPCSVVDHPEHCNECEVTMQDTRGYTREIAFFTDRWRRFSDEAEIAVVAWKEPSEPYQPGYQPREA